MNNVIQSSIDTRDPNVSLTSVANITNQKQPWGLKMGTNVDHPFCPMGGMVRVRFEYRAVVAKRYGEFYASSNLAFRERKGDELLFAPVAIGPGNVAMFIWPPAPINADWIEFVGKCD